MFSIDDIIQKEEIDINNTLIINPNKNIYNENHKFYNLANNFVMKPIAYYIKTIENASKIIMSTSCFYCLLLQIKVKTDDVYYISIYNYDYLFDDKYNYVHRVKRYLKN
jgi:hypothetical protein